MKTVVGLYDHLDDARQAINDMRDTGFRSEDISIIARDSQGEYSRHLGENRPAEANDISDGTAVGAGIGAVIGGLGGLLLGLGMLAIPGIGPVLAAGPLVATLTGVGFGALAGGVLGALVDLGIPEEHAEYYAEGLRRGGTLLLVRADNMMADRAMTIMNRYNPADVNARAEAWREQGWKGYDPNAEPLSADDVEIDSPIERESAAALTEDSTFGLDSQDLDRDDMENEYIVNREQHSIPITGPTSDPLAMDRAAMNEASVDFDDEQISEVCMPHYQANYTASGQDYSYYQPAYRLGANLANDSRYDNKDWEHLESIAQQEWARQGNQSAWEDVKDAVRYAWYAMKHWST